MNKLKYTSLTFIINHFNHIYITNIKLLSFIRLHHTLSDDIKIFILLPKRHIISRTDFAPKVVFLAWIRWTRHVCCNKSRCPFSYILWSEWEFFSGRRSWRLIYYLLKDWKNIWVLILFIILESLSRVWLFKKCWDRLTN